MSTLAMEHYAADVVIVGFGAAGAATALGVAARGKSAIILEAQPEHAHTPSTMMSGGLIMGSVDAAATTDYLDACAGGLIPSEISRAWATRAAELATWVEARTDLRLRHIGSAEHTSLPGADSITVLQARGETDSPVPGVQSTLAAVAAGTTDTQAPKGFEVFLALRKAVARERRVVIRYSARATRLVQDEHGAISGVSVNDGAESMTVSASSGVVLACGGFGADEELKRNFLSASPIYFYGNPGNRGDGIRMAQAVGADLWHMNRMVGRGVGRFEHPDGRNLVFALRVGPPGYVIVDRDGQRFSNEHTQAEMGHAYYYELIPFDSASLEYRRIPSYWIFDERRRRSGPLVSTRTGPVRVGMYDWSNDNMVEIERGWIARGTTVEEAAAAAGVRDPDAAAQSVRDYNDQCATGRSAFGRPASTMVPLDRPPFYCVPLYPGGSNTSGGPRRDEHARVLDSFGSPIPGLFAAGELGQPIGLVYPADGANLSEAICFGRVAAESAADRE